ncbi:unnamed protein product, partial [Menidia menidia]
FVTPDLCPVCSGIKFIERSEGESVVLPCRIDQRIPPPIAFYLKRIWLNATEVVFQYTKFDFSASNPTDKNRISLNGDPSNYSVDVTISNLRTSDTDRYICEYIVKRASSEDERIPGTTEFFLLVSADIPSPMDLELIGMCAGGSTVIPCFAPHNEDLAVEGVTLKRKRGRAPVEVVYHSKWHHNGVHSQFPAERVELSSESGPGGITHKLTLQRLQPNDSALYSCQLLQSGRPASRTSLGRRVFFVSVQDSSYPTLLYALSSVVGVLLLILLVVGTVVIFKGKANRSTKSHPQAEIYEEMIGMQSPSRKLPPRHLEEVESSEYRNCSVKKSCPENYYESPSGALFPRKASQK